MNIAYLRDNLAGAWQVMLGRTDGLNRLDTSLEGFWRSFAAVIIIAPFALLALISEQPILAENDAARPLTGGAITLYGIALLVDWFAFPLIFAILARPFDLGPHYVPFIVARNWSAVMIGAMVAAVHALHLLGILPSAVMPFALIVVTAVALRFAYVIARTALFVSVKLALPIVILDFAISLMNWTVFDRLVRIYCM